jgi:hypothetical protein
MNVCERCGVSASDIPLSSQIRLMWVKRFAEQAQRLHETFGIPTREERIAHATRKSADKSRMLSAQVETRNQVTSRCRTYRSSSASTHGLPRTVGIIAQVSRA